MAAMIEIVEHLNNTKEDFKLWKENLGHNSIGRDSKYKHAKVKQEHRHKGDRDRGANPKLSSLNPKKPDKKFIEVNCSYETIFKDVSREVFGMPSTIKRDNIEKRKTSNKWCTFHEDYGHLIKDYISLKVQVGNQIDKGKLFVCKKNTSSTIMVITSLLYQTRYIKHVFARVDAITRGQRTQEYDIKREIWKRLRRSINSISKTESTQRQ